MTHPFLFSVLLLSISTTFTSVVLAADENSQTTFPIESVNSCKGLSEKDSCQIHGKTNNLVNGTCRTKPVATDNFELVCVPEQPNKNSSTDSDTGVAQGEHQQQRKRH